MKRRIIQEAPTPTIHTSNLHNRALIGMEAGGTKYLLISILDVDKKVAFVTDNGTFWNSYTSRDQAINSCINDSRCKLFVFDTLQEIANWINETKSN